MMDQGGALVHITLSFTEYRENSDTGWKEIPWLT